MSEQLSDAEIQSALRGLSGWRYEKNALRKTFRFGSFPEALAFIVRVAFHAEAQNHHPELTNVYDRVEIGLSTHDAGDKVTARDVRLARAIEEVQGSRLKVHS